MRKLSKITRHKQDIAQDTAHGIVTSGNHRATALLSLMGLSSTKFIPWLALALSLSLLLGALAFQHWGGFAPCQMCYWQRHAHKAILGIASLTLIIRYLSQDDLWDKPLILFIGLAFLVSFGLAFWHMGVEYKWWEGPKSCAAIAINSPINMNDIQKIFEQGAKLPACSDAPWHMFKLSMAGYNAILSGLAAFGSFFIVLKGNHYA